MNLLKILARDMKAVKRKLYLNGLLTVAYCTGGINMLTNGVITHFEKLVGYRSKTYKAYFEKQDNSKNSKDGEKASHALFVAVPTLKELPFQNGDLIVIGKCSLKIDNTSEKAKSDSYRQLRNNCKVYTVSSVEPCLFGSKRMWHYELGCD